MTAALALLLACDGVHKLPTATLDVDGHAVVAEIADDPKEREQGLMNRPSMGPDEGMLFVYPDDVPRSFWMHNTPLPLSIAFADRKGVIVKIADMVPYDEQRVQSLYPAMYALEMNQGWFASHDVIVGDAMKNLPAPPAP